MSDDQSYIATSPVMRKILANLAIVAADPDVRIMLLGETGVGKSFVARWIHQNSQARDKDMVSISSGELLNGLADSTLFGHKKGSFTSADKDRVGVIETANGSTLFIDEIGDLPPESQLKLLTFLDRGNFRRVGESEDKTSSPRMIVATNKPIPSEHFREDLYFRLNDFQVTIPPLRERPEDIVAISNHIWSQIGEKKGIIYVLDDSALDALKSHSWPGNIRELEKTIKLSALFAKAKGKFTLYAGDIYFQPQTSAAKTANGLVGVFEEHAEVASDAPAAQASSTSNLSALRAQHKVKYGEMTAEEIGAEITKKSGALLGELGAILGGEIPTISFLAKNATSLTSRPVAFALQPNANKGKNTTPATLDKLNDAIVKIYTEKGADPAPAIAIFEEFRFLHEELRKKTRSR